MTIDAAQILSDQLRSEAKNRLNKLFNITDEMASIEVDRIVDFIIDCSMLEIANLHKSY
jgi:cytoplasmic iron level regulating protein YaaA (DUF328/UPF0246 family)